MPTINTWNTPDLTTNGQILIGKTGNRPVAATISSTANTLTVTNGAGTIDVATKAVLQTDTGFGSWSAGGPYFNDTTLGSFTILVAGSGYINGVPVTWAGGQTVTGMTAGNTYWIYIDSAGTIGKVSSRTDALFQNNIVLFECLRDSTPVTNNQVTVKENHPYNYPVNSSNYEHDNIGTLIENLSNGANITLNGTQGIQINGADVLSDHGIETTIPDSGGAAVTWIKMYTDGTGKWARQNATTTFTGFYNNAGTPTALGASKFAVYTLYVSKENLNVTTPTYFAVLDTSQYNNSTAATTAISNGTTARASNELAGLELCQLGYIVYSQTSSSITSVIISKTTLRSTVSTTGTNQASLVNTNTTNFNGVLSTSDTNVQAALETIDEYRGGLFRVEATANGNMVSNRGYIIKHATPANLLTLTLPATAIQGDTMAVNGYTAGMWRIAQNANQQIFFGSSATTIGVGGYLEATHAKDAIRLVCVTAGASTEWAVASSIGNITVV